MCNILSYQKYSHILHYSKHFLRHKELKNRYQCRLRKLFANASCYLHQKSIDPNWGRKKHQDKRKIKLGNQYDILREDLEEIEQKLKPKRASVKAQGDIIRKLKSEGVSEIEIKDAVQKLNTLKKELEEMTAELLPTETFDRARMADLVNRRFYYSQSFEIYGGMSGFYEFGPLGCQIFDNILAEWNKHFVMREQMLKVQTPIFTPEAVFKASGHLKRFVDAVVEDEKTKEAFRLDHLLKQALETKLTKGKLSEEQRAEVQKKMLLLESFSLEEMTALAKEIHLKSPTIGNPLSEPTFRNLMFPVSFGPSGPSCFLRPETCHGVFLNFHKLLDFKQGKLPFACAQVGTAFRNEINAKSGLLRVREFQMAEIQHFCLPNNKSHSKFSQVSKTKLWLYTACDQVDCLRPKLMSIGEAVGEGLVANETLGFYMARTQLFLVKIGVAASKLRFRQHLRTEMAHYAKDCWDAECLTSYGWVECVGLADRDAYDLKRHSEATGVDLSVELSPDGSERIDEDAADSTPKNRIYPCVIEPSYGIGRIFYSILEHNFRVRENNDRRTFFALPPVVAPYKVAVLPVIDKSKFDHIVQSIADALKDLDLYVYVDESRGTVGRKYVKMDERSVPYTITVDEETLASSPSTVTLRERDSTKQIRIMVEAIPSTVKDLSEGRLVWSDLVTRWPNVPS